MCLFLGESHLDLIHSFWPYAGHIASCPDPTIVLEALNFMLSDEVLTVNAKLWFLTASSSMLVLLLLYLTILSGSTSRYYLRAWRDKLRRP
jgi:hypothetical protein